MALSDLVNFYNRLCESTSADVKHATDLKLQEMVKLSQHTDLDNFRINVLESFDQFNSEFEQIKTKIKNQISEEERPYIQDSYKVYEQMQEFKYHWIDLELPDELPEHLADQHDIKRHNIQRIVDSILNTQLNLTEEAQDRINGRILRYSSWQKTTMILHPGKEFWLNSLVSNDPLYLLDENYDLLRPFIDQFNEQYQQRLRPYVIREDQEQEILWQMPDTQFGVALAYNYFNNRPFDVIRRYLTEIYKKLRPGGVLLMTYNDCDRWEGVKAVENKIALYTPGALIQDFAANLGFEQIFSWHNNSPWTWIEFRKPGEWESLRGGQAMAKILPKPLV